jgi:DNA repair protein RecN (Recombination protein N)
VIEQITIRGLGVIESAELELHPGFTAVTGETGAGKTMLLTGLGLLLGGRADAQRVRDGDRAEVEGRFAVAEGSEVARRVGEAGGELDEGALVVARTVTAAGRSRAYAGGRSAPAALLAELADDLVAVHGQSDQRRLLAPARQREALDRFGGDRLAEPLREYQQTWADLRATRKELAAIGADSPDGTAPVELLRMGLAEVQAAGLSAGEDDALRAEAGRLEHAEALRAAAALAHTALVGTDDSDQPDVVSLLVAAQRELDAQRDHDAVLAKLADRVAELVTLAADAGGDLAGYATAVEVDPARLATVQDRRAVLAALSRKYGGTTAEVLRWADAAAERLSRLQQDEERQAELAQHEQRLRAELAARGDVLSSARRGFAAEFASAVTAELTELAMPQARIEVTVRDAAAPGPSGLDEVELALVPHAGALPRPLADAASGGELSRVMLAIEVVFADAAPVPAMVFDEVDAGIGGAAAIEVGRRLARLARRTQVLVVTHLAQVAAFADHQVVVEKRQQASVTTADVRTVVGEDRLSELARMLGGLAESEAAGVHAAELLELARRDQVAWDGREEQR